MSVVGPRPLLVQYLPLYNEHQARRHEVRPGFTGYAQVHGRNAITWEDKFDKDVYYVDHITFLGDWKIIFQTVKTVLTKEGINSETAATMETFHGSQNKETEDVKKSDVLLTIFTPTYNRGYVLGKLYESLCKQTCFKFEWLIVDDGSEDDTSAKVKKWMKENDKFKIRYI